MTLPLPIPGPPDASLAPLTYEIDHVAVALDLLLQQFKDKPLICGLLESYILQIQDLEDAFWFILSQLDLDQAVDAHLDGLGALVGEQRRDELDDGYRRRIRVRILVNRCNGKHAEILRILALYLDLASGAGLVRLTEPGAAKLRLEVLTPAPSLSELGLLAREAKGGGVELDGRAVATSGTPYRFGWTSPITGVTGAANGDGWASPATGGELAARV